MMKVRDLISKLQEYNPEAIVVIETPIYKVSLTPCDVVRSYNAYRVEVAITADFIPR
jgi:hypothetical protein